MIRRTPERIRLELPIKSFDVEVAVAPSLWSPRARLDRACRPVLHATSASLFPSQRIKPFETKALKGPAARWLYNTLNVATLALTFVQKSEDWYSLPSPKNASMGVSPSTLSSWSITFISSTTSLQYVFMFRRVVIRLSVGSFPCVLFFAASTILNGCTMKQNIASR
jgi:hypothetical protein